MDQPFWMVLGMIQRPSRHHRLLHRLHQALHLQHLDVPFTPDYRQWTVKEGARHAMLLLLPHPLLSHRS